MYLVMLLLIPVLIGVSGIFWSRGRITLKEFFVLEGVLVLVVGVGYALARYHSIADTEVWNGQVVDKKKVRVSCSHSYMCNPHPCMCDDDGCQTCWDTCYEHTNDWDWRLYTNNDERITIRRVDRRGSRMPPRYRQAQIGDPTALTHPFKNYIKANPEAVLRRRGAVEKFEGLIPEYPADVYDYHYIDRFVSVGFDPPEAAQWNRSLQEMNARLGPRKEVNIVIVVAQIDDPSYAYAVEEAWIGGKKNDLVIIVGAPEYPAIDWVYVMSWSQSEGLKVRLRDALLELGGLENVRAGSTIISAMVEERFVRRSMEDFKYLMSSVQPGRIATLLLFLFGVVMSIGLTVYFYHEDPFDSGYSWR